ncbi:cytochrome b [Paracoccus gahaiensis]|uniref:Cytochrome b n=1 Tax=Paracoccus gahaiensis TaxID=1706839 RepID=A0A4U0RDH4_9RHOB|nr:cytochrome b [Paracoccus gahaiensis]TJZ92632.1 cytochrome b [Paracoccus gahaiensis]
MTIRDSTARYGSVSRAFHWAVAALMLWQFGGMLSEKILGEESPLAAALSANHTQVGTILFLLIVARAVWALVNRGQRPAHGPGLQGYAVRLGHFALYALMLAVPSAALLRAWGNERAFAPFGFQIFAPRSPDEVVGTATAIGSNFHGELAWIMGVLILGHIAMAILHQVVLRDGTLKRMAG